MCCRNGADCRFPQRVPVDAASDPNDPTQVAAPEVLDILALKENGFGGFEKTHLAAQTEVRHSHFSLTVPQGWTVAVLPATVRYAANLTMTPTGEVVDDSTYLGIHALQGRVEMSLEQKRLDWEKTLEPGDKLSIVEWQRIPWVLCEYQCESEAIEWSCVAAWTVHEHEAALMVSGTPLEFAGTFQQTLLNIMQSVRLHFQHI